MRELALPRSHLVGSKPRLADDSEDLLALLIKFPMPMGIRLTFRSGEKGVIRIFGLGDRPMAQRRSLSGDHR